MQLSCKCKNAISLNVKQFVILQSIINNRKKDEKNLDISGSIPIPQNALLSIMLLMWGIPSGSDGKESA